MKQEKGRNNTIQLIWNNAEDLSMAAAHYFVKSCNESIAKKGCFTVALSGGSTPKRLYEILATPEFSRNINWKEVLFFWGDERFVPHTHQDSNYRMTKEALFDKVNIPKKNIFPVPTKGWPQDCAQQYADDLKKVLGRTTSFDLVLLGMGDDGHTASLFPDTKILEEQKKLISEVWVDAKQTWRISFTYPLINKSKEIMLLAAGANKAPVIKKIFANRVLKKPFPVQLVNPIKGKMVWMLDEVATGK
ncbi:MAG: 6-phosphogluconolactonase [Niabella sp.]